MSVSAHRFVRFHSAPEHIGKCGRHIARLHRCRSTAEDGEYTVEEVSEHVYDAVYDSHDGVLIWILFTAAGAYTIYIVVTQRADVIAVIAVFANGAGIRRIALIFAGRRDGIA